ncbi:chorismate-binding protein [Christiangramia salexigens]|uniref:Isochorismate synthase n=1 Tax=Christiangramia salexigens TaxID=1913577 RepID=A0A1L3J273_9FLAO|nr:chorismate-binding protein [Christiangramia salexigens]APG59232.1 isochorismate synthase [Christiangramia salexigens]
MNSQLEFFDRLQDQLDSQKPFVAYSKPENNSRVKAFLQKEMMSYSTNDLKDSGFVFAPFQPEKPAYLIPYDHSDLIECEFDGSNYENGESRSVESANSETQKTSHEKLVKDAILEIEKGSFEKVVLSRSEAVQAGALKPLNIFQTILSKYATAMVYIWFHPETGIWMGATPETLVESHRTNFKTMALAGTQLYKEGHSVNWGTKEIEEQEFVTSYIYTALQEMDGIYQVKASEPYTKRAGNILHICTDITGKLKSARDIGELVKALHPTPAVCGLPKESALRFILDNENYDRQYYSGFLGELNIKNEVKRSGNRRNQENQQFAAISTKTHLFVNLRCMKIDSGIANIFVGGGITKDSKPEDEWQETVNKSQTMKTVLVK